MAEPNGDAQQADDQQQGGASAGAQQGADTQPKGGTDADAMIPKARFDELNAKYKAATASAKEVDALKAKLKDHEDAKLSEQEKLQNRIKEMEQQQADRDRRYRAIAAENALISAFSGAGARHIDLLVSKFSGRVEFDADGTPTNVEALVADAKKEKADLFRAASGSADGGAGNGQRDKAATAQDMNGLIRRFAGRGAT